MKRRFNDFYVPPVTRSDAVGHLVSTALNAGLSLWGLVWVASHWGIVQPSWLAIAIAVAVGLFIGDFLSGVLHWAFDTWFDETMGPLSRMVVIVREHHIYPQNIFRYGFRDEAGPVSVASLGFTAPIYLVVMTGAGAPSVVALAAILTCLVVSLCMALMLQCHKLGHEKTNSRILLALQRAGLLMSPRHHFCHHRGQHDTHYCLINGWADMVMDRIGFWRWAERMIAASTSAAPRRSDHEWRRHYGRMK